MFKYLDLRLQLARGRKQVLHDRATSRAGSYHQSRMVVDWDERPASWPLASNCPTCRDNPRFPWLIVPPIVDHNDGSCDYIRLVLRLIFFFNSIQSPGVSYDQSCNHHKNNRNLRLHSQVVEKSGHWSLPDKIANNRTITKSFDPVRIPSRSGTGLQALGPFWGHQHTIMYTKCIARCP